MNGRHKSENSNIRRIQSQYVEEQFLLQEKLARRKKGLIRRLTISTVGIIIFIGFTFFTISNQNKLIQEQEATKSRLEEELQALQNKEEELLLEIENLHDPEYIADIARRDFYLSNPGETLFPLPRTSSGH